MNKKQIRVIRVKFKKRFGYTCKMSDRWIYHWIEYWGDDNLAEVIIFEYIRRKQSRKSFRVEEKDFLSLFKRKY